MPEVSFDDLVPQSSTAVTFDDLVPASSGPVEGSVFGLVPNGNGGWMHDPNDITDRNVPGFDPNHGAWGAPIKDPNLAGVALSPKQLLAAGINPNDPNSVAGAEVKVITPSGDERYYPIVDKLGTPGRIDFTAKAYQELGGPMNRGGGTIPGLQYQIVPKGSRPPISGQDQFTPIGKTDITFDDLIPKPQEPLPQLSYPDMPGPSDIVGQKSSVLTPDQVPPESGFLPSFGAATSKAVFSGLAGVPRFLSSGIPETATAPLDVAVKGALESTANTLSEIGNRSYEFYNQVTPTSSESKNLAAQIGRGAGAFTAAAPLLATGGLAGLALGGGQMASSSYSQAYDAALEKTGDPDKAQAEARLEAAKTAPALAGYILGGKLGSVVAGKLAGEAAGPLVKALYGTAGAAAANTASGSVIRTVEGMHDFSALALQDSLAQGNWKPTAETLTMDVLFGIVHGGNTYSEAVKARAAEELQSRGLQPGNVDLADEKAPDTAPKEPNPKPFKEEIDARLSRLEEEHGPREMFDQAAGKAVPARILTTEEDRLLKQRENAPEMPIEEKLRRLSEIRNRLIIGGENALHPKVRAIDAEMSRLMAERQVIIMGTPGVEVTPTQEVAAKSLGADPAELRQQEAVVKGEPIPLTPEQAAQEAPTPTVDQIAAPEGQDTTPAPQDATAPTVEPPVYRKDILSSEPPRPLSPEEQAAFEKARQEPPPEPVEFVLPKRAEAAGDVMVDVDVKKFDEAFAKDKSMYVSPTGEGEIAGRRAGFEKFLEKGGKVEVPEVHVDEKGNVAFTNGRHRYSVLRDKGQETVKMAMTPEAANNARKAGLLREPPAEPPPAAPEAAPAPAPEPEGTSIKNAQIDADRVKHGLPPILATERKSDATTWDNAMRRIEEDPDIGAKLVDRLEKKTGPHTDEEAAILRHRRAVLELSLQKAGLRADAARESGVEGDIQEARMRTAEVLDELDRLHNVLRTSGRELGLGLRSRKVELGEDISPATLLRKETEARNRKLTPQEAEEVLKKQKVLQAAKDAAEAAAAKVDEKQSVAQAEEVVKDMVKSQPKPRGKQKPKPAAVEWLKSKADQARENIRKRREQGDRLFSGPADPEELTDYAIIGASRIAEGITDFVRWSAEMVKEFGEGIQPYLKLIFDQAQPLVNRATEGQKREKLVQGIKTRLQEGDKPEQLGRYAQRLAETFVREGITKRDELVREVHKVLQSLIPDFTERQARDAISGYGDFKQLDQEDAKRTLRDLKGQMQQVSKIEDMQAKLAPKKTGVERRIPSDEERRLIKEVNELKKKGGFTITDPATQLRTAMEAVKTRLRNQISDLDYAIANKEPIVTKKGGIAYDAEAVDMRRQRDVRKAEYDAIFGKKGLTDEQRLKAAISAAERSAKEYEDRVRNKDLTGKPRSKSLTSPELEAAKARRDAAKADLEQLQALDAAFQEKALQTRLQRQIEAVQETLKTGTKAVKESKLGPDTEAVTKQKSELQRLRDMVARRRLLDSTRQDQKETARLEKRVSDLEKTLREGEIAKASKLGPDSKRNAELKEQVRELNERVRAAREASPEFKAKEDQRALDAAQKTIAEYDRRIREADFSTKSTPTKPVSLDVERARAERDAVARFYQELKNASKPRPTPEEIALKSYKSRKATAIAELQEKLAKGDISKKPRRTVTLDPEATKLQEEYQRLKLDMERQRRKIMLEQRGRVEKTLDGISKWRRAFVLSGVKTLAKLTSAAGEILVISPVEELVQTGYAKLLPFIASRAPRRSGINLRAEVRAVTETWRNLFRDIGSELKTGQMDIDVLYGKPKINPPELKDLVANVHGALKSPARRYEFTKSFDKRIDNYAAAGVDVTDPLVQTRAALEAYKNASQSIFQDSNILAEVYRRALSRFSQPDKLTGKPSLSGKVGETLLRYTFPVVRIPTNIVARTFEYMLGTIPGTYRLSRALVKGIEHLQPDEADLIMQNLSRGSIGAAVLLVGYFNPDVFGGYWQQGEKRKEEDVKAMHAKINGVDIPTYLLHHPLLMAAQVGATVRRVADSKLRKKDKEAQGITQGVVAGALGLIEEIPFMREMVHTVRAFNPYERGLFMEELGKSAVPIGISQIAQWMDENDPNTGEPVKRKGGSFLEGVQESIPGLRQNVPIKEEKKPAKKKEKFGF